MRIVTNPIYNRAGPHPWSRLIQPPADRDQDHYHDLYDEYESLAIVFHHRSLIPIADATPEGGLIMHVPGVQAKDTADYYIGKWTQLESVVEEIVNCTYIKQVLGDTFIVRCRYSDALMSQVRWGKE